ncbi:hypothetical protein ACQP1V_42840 (plasmid) [Microtetraspora malaysiensis]|uniref:hypothetical protein n=1 Tax=Microtetraspora malaysiensis TaxID=161358 RepID=UPI003D94F4EB
MKDSTTATVPVAPEDARTRPQSPAERIATELCDALAKHNIPAHAYVRQSGRAVVSICAGLLAHTDGAVIWWNVPDLDGSRSRTLMTYARIPKRAAKRLALAHEQLRSVPLADLLSSGRITLFGLLLAREEDSQHEPHTL